MSKLIIFQNGKIVRQICYDSRLNQSIVSDHGFLEFNSSDKLVFRISLNEVDNFQYLENKTVIFLLNIDEEIQLKLKNAILEDSLGEIESEIVSEVYKRKIHLFKCEILFKISEFRFRLYIADYITIDKISVNYITIDSFIVNSIQNN